MQRANNRKRLQFCFILILGVVPLWGGEEPAPLSPQVRERAPLELDGTSELFRSRDALPPLQGHRAPELYSFAVSAHPLLDSLLKEYGTPRMRRYLVTCLERGAPYTGFIAQTIADYGLPPELLYLPLVESGYNPEVVSSSGAVGLWQFMTNSIAPYGMRVTAWADERRDFWKATHGALQKLKDNYDEFGDWLLAVGAYNCGSGCMRRALEKTGAETFWELAELRALPAETIRYVPKFLAVIHYAAYAGRYGVVPPWPDDIRWERIRLKQAVDLRMLAEKSGVPYRLLLSGNAELNYPVTPPADNDYSLKIPSAYTDTVSRVLAENGSRLMRFRRHRIRTGDTLYELGRHYGLPAATIAGYNPDKEASRLAVGDTLLIPLFKEVPPPAAGTGGADLSETYQVRRGDTLWSLARRFGTTPEVLASGNGLHINSTLQTGVLLRIPGELD